MFDRRASPSPVEDENGRGKVIIRASDVKQREHVFGVQEVQEIYFKMDRKRQGLMERWNCNTLESVSTYPFDKICPKHITNANAIRF